MTHNYLHNYHAKYAEFRSDFSSSLMFFVVLVHKKNATFYFLPNASTNAFVHIYAFLYQFHFSVFALFGCTVADCGQTRGSWVRYIYSCVLVFAPFEPGRSNHDCHQISAWVSLTFAPACKSVYAWHMAWRKPFKTKYICWNSRRAWNGVTPLCYPFVLLGPNERHGKIETAYKHLLFYFCGHS